MTVVTADDADERRRCPDNNLGRRYIGAQTRGLLALDGNQKCRC